MKKISKSLIVLIGIVMILMACSTIFAINMPEDPGYTGYNDNELTSPDIAAKAKSFMSTAILLVQILCVVTLIAMGLRYMFTSAEGKANIKKEFVVWCVGAFIVFSATTIIGLVLNVVTGQTHVTITPSTSTGADSNDKEVSDWASEEWKGADRAVLIPESVKNSKPKDKISRVEFAESIYLLAGKAGINLEVPENYKEVSDVSSTDISEQIQALHNAGIIEGVSGNEAGDIKFDPNSNITRQDVATIMYRLLVKAGKDDKGISLAETQEDINKGTYNSVADYAKEAMIYMNRAKIIIGDENGNINPKDNTTCEQAIAIIYRTATSHGIVK